MRWQLSLARLSKHADVLAVVRAGRKAKLRTRRRERHAWRQRALKTLLDERESSV